MNRDSYVDAANDFGYNQQEGGHGQPGQQIPSYHPPSNAYGIQDGGDGKYLAEEITYYNQLGSLSGQLGILWESFALICLNKIY